MAKTRKNISPEAPPVLFITTLSATEFTDKPTEVQYAWASLRDRAEEEPERFARYKFDGFVDVARPEPSLVYKDVK